MNIYINKLKKDLSTLDNISAESEIYTVWIAIVDQSEEMGILEIFSGNKNKTIFNHTSKGIKIG